MLWRSWGPTSYATTCDGCLPGENLELDLLVDWGIEISVVLRSYEGGNVTIVDFVSLCLFPIVHVDVGLITCLFSHCLCSPFCADVHVLSIPFPVMASCVPLYKLYHHVIGL
jgi:hypothetical protein